MSFGVVQSAISSIKYNRSLLSKRSRLKNTLSSSNEKIIEFKSSKVTLQELKRIREKLQLEHKQIRYKQMIVFGILMLVIISVFIYLIQ